jgi:hypothetical protein
MMKAGWNRRSLITGAFALAVPGRGLTSVAALVTLQNERRHELGAVDAGPAQVLIIRHAEKPGDPSADDENDPNLSVKGRERAAALAIYIPATFQAVDFLFATKESQKSNRPVETIAPLSLAIQKDIDSHFANDEFDKLAQHVLTHAIYAGKRILICWHHGRIPSLAGALGVANAPAKWSGHVFDQVWRIDFADGNATLKILNQQLLFGDSSD